MKKMFLLFAILLQYVVASYGVPYKKDFRLQEFETVEGYQQYVGAKVKFLPSSMKKWGFNGNYDDVYVISSIEGEPFTESYSGDKNLKLKISFQQENGKKKFKATFYRDTYAKLFSSTIMQYELPVYLYDEFEKFKSKYLNKEFNNKETNTTFKIVDIAYKKSNKGSFKLFVTEENMSTGKREDILFSDIHGGNYVSTLNKVEKPADATIRYGETKVVKDKDVTKYSYIDNVIDILILGNSKEFQFVLKNVSENSIKLIWNEAAFVDFAGNTSKVMHYGTKFSQREAEQPASTIIKGAKIEDVATPTCNVYYYESSVNFKYNEWRTKSMYPTDSGLSPGQLRLMLPIQIKDVVNEYVFIFDVNYIYTYPELAEVAI